jgi:hypothetical protein
VERVTLEWSERVRRVALGGEIPSALTAAAGAGIAAIAAVDGRVLRFRW